MKEFITQCLLSLVTGLVVGAIFAFFKLSVPSPNVIGLFGVIGLTLGYVAFQTVFK